MFETQTQLEMKELLRLYEITKNKYISDSIYEFDSSHDIAMEIVNSAADATGHEKCERMWDMFFPATHELIVEEFYPEFPEWVVEMKDASRSEIILAQGHVQDYFDKMESFHDRLTIAKEKLENILFYIMSRISHDVVSGRLAKNTTLYSHSFVYDTFDNFFAVIGNVSADLFELNNNFEMFSYTATTLWANFLEINGIDPTSENPNRKTKHLSELGLTPAVVFDKFLKDTPLQKIFSSVVTCGYPNKIRESHHHIVAGSGHGKTQTIMQMIVSDFLSVKDNEASIIVIDSQGDLINDLSHSSVFAKGEELEGRLVLIEPKDMEYPVCLNLFHIPEERLKTYSPLVREQTFNGIIEIFEYVFSGLLGAEMTAKQSDLFSYITHLMLIIPNSTIHTLLDLMEDGAYERFEKHIQKLPPTAKRFFDTEFVSSQFLDTKKQVRRRLFGVLKNQTFERMMSHTHSKLDLFEEMNQSKVILISTSKDLLKQKGTEIFGRFFISLIYQAALERIAIPKNERKPCYVYIDECQDYVDYKITEILEQTRKFRIGVILAHQYLGQIPSTVLNSLHSNTAVKMAGSISSADARIMASEMDTTPEFIKNCRELTMAMSIRGKPITKYETIYGTMDRLELMSDAQWKVVRSNMRKKYAIHYSKMSNINEQDDTLDDIDEPTLDPTDPSPNWGDDV